MKISAMAMLLLLSSASAAHSGERLDFTAQTLEGDSLRLSDFRGSVVVIDFWATWCPPCREQLPRLAALEKQVPDVVVLAVCIDHHTDSIDRFAERIDLPQRIVWDPKGRLAEQLEVQAMPWTVLVDPHGRIVWQQATLPEEMDTKLLGDVRRLQGEHERSSHDPSPTKTLDASMPRREKS
jgi:thiol-disulfide isomerase/thioredoxin